MALERGQVIALRRNAPGLIFAVGLTHATVVPIGGYNGPPPHRAEVRFDHPSEVFSCGVSFRFPVARCHHAFEVALKVAGAAAILGRAPTSLMDRISRAIAREAVTRELESRLHFNDRRGGANLFAA
jgi:hypothetical protein